MVRLLSCFLMFLHYDSDMTTWDDDTNLTHIFWAKALTNDDQREPL